jgi:hypothetical protein
MKFEKEINFYDTPAIARKFSAQDTSFEAINGKISKIISDTQLTQYDNGQNTMASALNTAVSTATQNAQTLSTLQTSFNTKSGEFDTFKADYNDQLSTTKQNISTIGSVAASKGKIFSAQPSIPYQVNDIWLKNGQNGSEIYRCITAKTDAENDVFSNDDWVKATSYATSSELGSLSSTVSQIKQTANSVSLKVQASNNTHKLSDIVNGENYDMGDFVISESGVKRVTVEPNRDGNGNAIYRSTDLSDVTNEIPTSSEISTAIDNGISNATIRADHINFDSFELNMTSENFEISSNKFSVNSNGEVTCGSMTLPFSNINEYSKAWADPYGFHYDYVIPWSGYSVAEYCSGSRLTLGKYTNNQGVNIGATDRHGMLAIGAPEKVLHPAMIVIDNLEGGEQYGHLEICDNSINLADAKDSANFIKSYQVIGDVVQCKVLQASQAKSRVVESDTYGKISMYAYETATPLFGDVGEGIIGDDGQAYIYLDPKFLETIKTGTTYQVFLQSYSENSVYVSERKPEYFIVRGIPGSKFAWEMKGRQDKMQLEYNRLDYVDTKNMLPTPKFYDTMADRYIEKLRKERTV